MTWSPDDKEQLNDELKDRFELLDTLNGPRTKNPVVGKATVTVTIRKYNEGDDQPFEITKEVQLLELRKPNGRPVKRRNYRAPKPVDRGSGDDIQ